MFSLFIMNIYSSCMFSSTSMIPKLKFNLLDSPNLPRVNSSFLICSSSFFCFLYLLLLFMILAAPKSFFKLELLACLSCWLRTLDFDYDLDLLEPGRCVLGFDFLFSNFSISRTYILSFLSVISSIFTLFSLTNSSWNFCWTTRSFFYLFSSQSIWFCCWFFFLFLICSALLIRASSACSAWSLALMAFTSLWERSWTSFSNLAYCFWNWSLYFLWISISRFSSIAVDFSLTSWSKFLE